MRTDGEDFILSDLIACKLQRDCGMSDVVAVTRENNGLVGKRINDERVYLDPLRNIEQDPEAESSYVARIRKRYEAEKAKDPFALVYVAYNSGMVYFTSSWEADKSVTQ